jgi:hypothetical protein
VEVTPGAEAIAAVVPVVGEEDSVEAKVGAGAGAGAGGSAEVTASTVDSGLDPLAGDKPL